MEVIEFKNIVWGYTRKIEESMNNVFSPIIESHGLTMMQTRILMELHSRESHTVGSLANSVCVAGANISSMCKKLEGQGLVERVRNREDERVVRVALTASGREIVVSIDKMFSDKISQHLINEKKETLEDILIGLGKLNELLERISK